jgi:EAL domain-containing protein (putative c-di-GMP-specific phosphodiesterase class I)/signal transduction histidine kinase/DNA-binding response OmpR family regulator
LTSKSKNLPGSSASEDSLREEIAKLRARLAKAEDYIELQRQHRVQLSKMLKMGFWEWDEKTQQPIFYSPEMAVVLGVDEARLQKLFRNTDAFNEILHPDDLQYYLDNQDSLSLLAPGVSREVEYRILVGQREIRYLREIAQGVFDESGALVSSFGLLQDITDTKLAVEALRESEERYHSLFEQMPLGVQEEDYSAVKKVVDKLLFQGEVDLEEYFLSNPRILRELVGQTRITNVNQTLLRLHKAETREAFLASEADIDDWWDAQWVEYYAAEFAALAGDSKIYSAERVDSQIDGQYFETRSIATLVSGCEDSWERVVTIHEDISKRKRAEAELIEAKTQAERASQAKSDFLSNMSHELRTPLNAILGFAQLFIYDRELGERHHANAIEINRAGKHLMGLIDQILDLSRIEAGESDLSLEPVVLARVLGDSIRWVNPLAQERRISIDCDVAQFAGINLVADSIRLKQVFLNLLSNAVKYNRDGGRVEVIHESLDSGSLRIGIRDTGEGISDEKLRELFQPFNRLGAEFSGVEGTGIGLVISRQLVDLMKGKLDIESQVGAGSTFWVTLQLAPALAPVNISDTCEMNIIPGARRRGEKSRILVAEDNLINQELMAAQLDLLGYHADYAENGAQALAHWQKGDYQLLLTDIRMPEMNGYDLVREIRELEQHSGQRASVVAITANALEADVELCFEAGIDDVIAKPVELDDLRKALDKWAPAASSDAAELSPIAEAVETAVGDNAVEEVIDFEVLMQSTGDKPDLHRHLLQSYRDALAQELDHLQQAFAWKNSEQIVEYSHKLKSSSRSLGVTGMAQVCEALEAAAKKQSWPDLEVLVPNLQQNAARTLTSIEAYLQRQPEIRQPEIQREVDDRVDARQFEDDDEEVTQFSLKLLLVDDDYIMHRVTSVMLGDLGVSNVINAMSAPAALDILQAHGDAIDVIICDLNMPDMDGIEFIRHLAGREFKGSLILTSGEDMRILKTVEKLAIEHDLQVIGVLEKPVSRIRLGELLDSLDQIKQEGTLILFDAITLPELENAIREGELDVYLQPKIEIASGQVVGVEALARWNHPLKGLVRPDAFISLAEDHGLIGALTDAVCRKTMEYAARLKALDYDLNVAINLSVDSLTDLAWPEKVTAIQRQFGLEAGSICFEITESRLMEHLSVALDILGRLSLKRFNLSIDDFGTGYSSMEQLQRIPFSELKIDRAFVHGAASEASALAILESSVLLAKKLNMTVVAEGVEDQQDWDTALRVGCDQIQGYFVAKPLPYTQLVRWLKDPQVQKKFLPRA